MLPKTLRLTWLHYPMFYNLDNNTTQIHGGKWMSLTWKFWLCGTSKLNYIKNSILLLAHTIVFIFYCFTDNLKEISNFPCFTHNLLSEDGTQTIHVKGLRNQYINSSWSAAMCFQVTNLACYKNKSMVLTSHYMLATCVKLWAIPCQAYQHLRGTTKWKYPEESRHSLEGATLLLAATLLCTLTTCKKDLQFYFIFILQIVK